jgi:hypothetical protein
MSSCDFFDILKSLLRTREPVSSLDDLLQRCRDSMDLRMSRLATYGEECCHLQLGIPSSAEISDDQLSLMTPLYRSLLQDIEKNGSKSVYLSPLHASSLDEHDPACLLMYFLAYPALVRFARVARAESDKLVTATDIGSHISRNATIGAHCRAVLREPWEHHRVAILYSMTMLRSIFHLLLPSSPDKRRIVQAIVFSGQDAKTGLKELQANVAQTVLLEASSFDVFRAALLLLEDVERWLHHVHVNDNPNHVAPLKSLLRTSYKATFCEVLTEHAHAYPHEELEYYQCLLGLRQASKTVQRKSVPIETPICEAKECCQPARNHCKCRSVSYCSDECEKEDKTRHVHVCRSKSY